MSSIIENAIREIVDHAANVGLTSADIDQDSTLLRERLVTLLDGDLSESTVFGVAAGVWALQGFLLSDEENFGGEIQKQLAAVANLTIVWLNQILQGTRAAQICAEMMGTAQ